MLNRKSTFIQNIDNSKGQIALFVALIFQVLFLFFAMIINVGLLVHHKINLQNSVDLAAYYGAMRQAENMNAIAHMNYQIRQSWKLLSWRYRMLGSAGEWHRHPFNKERNAITGSTEDSVETSDLIGKNFQEAPAFCVTYIPFKPMPPDENTCREMATRSPTKLWDSPPVIAGHRALSSAIRNSSEAMRTSAVDRCKFFGSYNYVMLGKFIVAFNVDQGDRMAAIASLSKATSLKKEDFIDIDGSSVFDGVKKTLLNNLTSASRDSSEQPKIEMFNSLGVEGCNAQTSTDDEPAKWLTPIKIYPGFRYVDTACQPHDIIPVPKELSNGRNGFPLHMAEANMQNDIETLAQYIGPREQLNDLYNLSIGVEKNPWCMAYVGVSATAHPKIPFSPFGRVTLKARAFYKPFGGRIGPWYHKMWRRGATFSQGGPDDKTDPLLPPRVTGNIQSEVAQIGNDENQNATRAANFSRFVGDLFGLKTFKMLAFYGKAIYHLDGGWRKGGNSIVLQPGSLYEGDDAPNFAHWDELPFHFTDVNNGSGDILAFDSKNNRPSRMRALEMSAILPDLFDMAYYSIEPDYYHNYYLRLRDGYFKKVDSKFSKLFRPDIGYRKNYKQGPYDFEQFSIKDQFKFVNDPDDIVGIRDLLKDQFTFTVSDWTHLLTGWAPKSLLDYSLNTDKFGKCDATPIGADQNDPKPPTSGNCVVGGTTGFSVKLVSSDYLHSAELSLGGQGGGVGPLLNPPPPDTEF